MTTIHTDHDSGYGERLPCVAGQWLNTEVSALRGQEAGLWLRSMIMTEY